MLLRKAEAAAQICYNEEPARAETQALAQHPNKQIREAIKYAEEQGWRFTKSSGQAHIFGTIWCRLQSREGCRFRVFRHQRVWKTMPRIFGEPLIAVIIEPRNIRCQGS